MTHPTIGIRPVIDGRWGGVRESLEAQTMKQAQAAKALIEAHVRYADGTPAKCVIPPAPSAVQPKPASAPTSSPPNTFAPRSASPLAGAMAAKPWTATRSR